MNKNFWKKTAAGIMALLIVSGGVLVEPVADFLTVSKITASAGTNVDDTNSVKIEYIDEYGNTNTTYAVVFDGSETTLSGGVYFVNDNIVLSSGLSLKASAKFIIADGASLSIGTKDNPVEGCGISDTTVSLRIYGQKEQTGKFEVYSKDTSVSLRNYTQYGVKSDIHSLGGYGLKIQGILNIIGSELNVEAKDTAIFSDEVNIDTAKNEVKATSEENHAISGKKIYIRSGKITVESENSESFGVYAGIFVFGGGNFHTDSGIKCYDTSVRNINISVENMGSRIYSGVYDGTLCVKMEEYRKLKLTDGKNTYGKDATVSDLNGKELFITCPCRVMLDNSFNFESAEAIENVIDYEITEDGKLIFTLLDGTKKIFNNPYSEADGYTPANGLCYSNLWHTDNGDFLPQRKYDLSDKNFVDGNQIVADFYSIVSNSISLEETVKEFEEHIDAIPDSTFLLYNPSLSNSPVEPIMKRVFVPQYDYRPSYAFDKDTFKAFVLTEASTKYPDIAEFLDDKLILEDSRSLISTNMNLFICSSKTGGEHLLFETDNENDINYFNEYINGLMGETTLFADSTLYFLYRMSNYLDSNLPYKDSSETAESICFINLGKYNLVPAKEATCTTDGNIEYYERNGEYYVLEKNSFKKVDNVVIPKKGHKPVTEVKEVSPTYEKNGYRLTTVKCSVCGEILSVKRENIPKLTTTTTTTTATTTTTRKTTTTTASTAKTTTTTKRTTNFPIYTTTGRKTTTSSTTTTYPQTTTSTIYSITVKNGTIKGKTSLNVQPGTLLKAVADEPKENYKFGYWKRNGEIAGYNTSYIFSTSAENIELEAVYIENTDDIERYGNIMKKGFETNVKDPTNNKISFTFSYNVPNDCNIVKGGIFATSDAEKAKNLSEANADYVKVFKTDKHTYDYTWTKGKVDESQTWYVRAYLVYTDKNGNEKTIYSDMEKADLNGSETIKEEKVLGTGTITKAYSEKGNAVFVTLLNVRADCKIVTAGLVATNNAEKAKNLTAENADYVKEKTTTAHTYEYTWTKSKASGQTWYARPYLIYKDSEGKEHTVYGELKSVTVK